MLQSDNEIWLSYRVLGCGSNLLLPTSGLSDCIIKLGRGFRYCKPQGDGFFRVGGMMPLMGLSRELSEQGWAGLEFGGGIPASIGGAVRMNAGAHKSDMSAIVSEVTFVTPEGTEEHWDTTKLSFDYRHSNLPEGSCITDVVLKLTPSNPNETSERRQACLAYRKATQPLTVPSAGSIFRNPSQDLAAGQVIERLGLKGRVHGGAKISELHGNWIVNENREATSREVSQLIEICQSEALSQMGVTLKTELVRW